MNIGMVMINLIIASGIPVAWGITDTEDINIYTTFFSTIKKRVPDACF